jgi:hypothetical protein
MYLKSRAFQISNRLSPESEQASSFRRDPDASRVHDLATGPQINVYASLPWTVTVESGGSPDVNPNDWQWVHCLTIPLHTFNALHDSQKSYKWIRYAIGVVTGTEGTLSTSPDLPNTMDDDVDLPAESVDLYYHTSVEERQRVFPIDPDITCTHVTATGHTDWREDFCSDVAVRDHQQCVLTQALNLDVCKAAHLLAHINSD